MGRQKWLFLLAFTLWRCGDTPPPKPGPDYDAVRERAKQSQGSLKQEEGRDH